VEWAAVANLSFKCGVDPARLYYLHNDIYFNSTIQPTHGSTDATKILRITQVTIERKGQHSYSQRQKFDHNTDVIFDAITVLLVHFPIMSLYHSVSVLSFGHTDP
jgi:hypothetical protein